MVEDEMDEKVGSANSEKLVKNNIDETKTLRSDGENDKTDTETESRANKSRINENLTAIWIDKLLDYLRKEYFAGFFEKNEQWLTKAGLYGLYVSALLGLIISIVFPIRYDALPFGSSICIGLVWFFVCIISHYTAYKFLPNIINIIQTTPSKLSSKSFLDSLAVVTGIGGVLALVGGLYLWIKTSEFNTFLGGIFIFIFCEYLLSLFLNPNLLNIKITKQTTAGEEFIGLISFFIKSFLKLIPIVFGSGIIVGVINLIELLFMKIEYLPQIIVKGTQISSLTAMAFLPIFGYLLFLINYFFIDIASSILSTPQKIDKLRESK